MFFFLIVLASKPNLHNGNFRLTYQQQPTTSPWPPESSDGPRFVGLVQLFGLEENRRVLLLGEGSLARCAFPNFPGKKVGRLHSLRLTISPLKISHPKRKLHLPLSFEEGIYKQVQNLQTHWVSKQSRVAKREFSTCHLVNILRERVVWDFFSQAEIYGSYHQLEGIDQLHWENMGSLQILISTSFGWALKFWVSSPFHLLFFGGLSPLPPHQRPFKNWWGKFFPKLWPHWSGFEMNLWGETKHSCKANFFCSWNFGPWMKMYFPIEYRKNCRFTDMWCNRFTRVYTQNIMIIWDKWQHHLSNIILSMISQEISPLLLPSPNWTLSSHCCWAEKRQLKRNPIWTNFSGEMLQLFLVVLRHNRFL